MEHIEKMRRPTQLWQVLAIVIGVLTPITIGLLRMRDDLSKQQVEINNLKTDQYNNQLKVEKEFDKLGIKIDDQTRDIRQILIEMQNKQNRAQ